MRRALAPVLLALVLGSAACGAASPQPAAAPSAVVSTSKAKPSRFSAQSLADRLGDKFPMPNPRDNTHSCRSWCAQLITTDPVSIYEFRGVPGAKKFEAAAFAGTVRRVGRFVLSWTGRRAGAGLPSKKVRMAMGVEAARLVKLAGATP